MGITGPSQNSYTLDQDMRLKTAGLVAASAAEATELDLGAAYHKGALVVDVSAIEVASDDEIYDIVLQGTNVAAFATDTDIWDLVTLTLAAAAAQRTDANGINVVGRYVIPFDNEHAGTLMRYIRLYTVVAGTIATGINYTAFVAPDHS